MTHARTTSQVQIKTDVTPVGLAYNYLMKICTYGHTKHLSSLVKPAKREADPIAAGGWSEDGTRLRCTQEGACVPPSISCHPKVLRREGRITSKPQRPEISLRWLSSLQPGMRGHRLGANLDFPRTQTVPGWTLTLEKNILNTLREGGPF